MQVAEKCYRLLHPHHHLIPEVVKSFKPEFSRQWPQKSLKDQIVSKVGDEHWRPNPRHLSCKKLCGLK